MGLFETLSALVILFSDYEQGRPLFLYPEKIIHPWSRAHNSDFKCPPLLLQDLASGLMKDSVKIYRQSEHTELTPVPGHLCSGLDYVTHCSENFFGTKTLTKKILHSSVNPDECSNEYKKYLLGESLSPYFPAEDCKWMGDKDAHKKFIVVEPHSVRFDPYKSAFVDGLFQSGVCETNFCNTVHENTKWVSEFPIKSKCSPFSASKGINYKKSGDLAFIQWGDHQINTYKDACQMVYCGQRGIRFNNGMFIGFMSGLDKFSFCPENITVSIQPVISMIEDLETKIQDYQDRFICLDAVQSLRSGENINFLTLGKLQPKFPGVFSVYRINNGTIEKSLAQWEPIYSFPKDPKNIQLGWGKRDSRVIWEDWVPSGMAGITSGFNGVHRREKDKAIIIPDIELLKMEYEESLLAEHDLKKVEHPIVELAKKEGLDDPLDVLEEKDSSSFGEWVGKVWNSITGKITTIILMVVGCVLALLSIYLCIKCWPKKAKKVYTKAESEEWID